MAKIAAPETPSFMELEALMSRKFAVVFFLLFSSSSFAARTAMVFDAAGDQPELKADLIYAAALWSDNYGKLLLRVQYAPGGYTDDAIAIFNIDADGDPATGYPGVTAQCPGGDDDGVVGVEYGVRLNPSGHRSGDFAEILRIDGCPFQLLAPIELVPRRVLRDGYEVEIPLSLLPDLTDQFTFKVTSQFRVNDAGAASAIKDYMPDVGAASDPAQDEALQRSNCGGALAACSLAWNCTGEPVTSLILEASATGMSVCKSMANLQSGLIRDAALEGFLAVADLGLVCVNVSGVSSCLSLAWDLYYDEVVNAGENWLSQVEEDLGNISSFGLPSGLPDISQWILGLWAFSPIAIEARDGNGNAASVSGDGNAVFDSDFPGAVATFGNQKKLVVVTGNGDLEATLSFVGDGVTAATNQYSLRLAERSRFGFQSTGFTAIDVQEAQHSQIAVIDSIFLSPLATDTDLDGMLDSTTAPKILVDEEFPIFTSGFEPPALIP